MKARKSNTTRRIATLTTFALMACLAMATFIVSASEESEEKPVAPAAEEKADAWKGRFYFGLGYGSENDNITDVTGLSAGRAAEYMPTELFAILGVKGFYDKGTTYAQISAGVYTADDLFASIYSSAGRNIMLDLTLDRFLHRLDNDDFADFEQHRSFSSGGDAGEQEMEMRATILNSKIRFKASSIPSSVLFLHGRIVAREGDRQARSMDHCFSCHVNANGQELDQMMVELSPGVEYAKAPFAIRYQHRYRNFSDSSEDLTYTWTNFFGNFDLEGTLPYAVTPDNTRNSDIIEGRLDIQDVASASGRLRFSTTENDSTGNQLETTHVSLRGSLHPTPFLKVRSRYDYWDTENSVPFSAQRKITRFDVEGLVRPVDSLRLSARYRYNKTEREGGTSVAETEEDSIRIKGVFKPSRQFRIVASHTFTDRTDPMGHVLKNAFSTIDGTILSPYGTDVDRTYLNMIYSPNDASYFDVVYSYSNEEEEGEGLEATFNSISGSANFLINEKATLYGQFSYFKNEYEKDVYFGVLAPFLDVGPLPYEGTGTTLGVGGNLWIGCVNVNPSWMWTKVETEISDSAFGGTFPNVGMQDITVNRLGLDATFPFIACSEASLGYWFEDYQDDFYPNDDGNVHWFGAWISYEF